MAARFIPPEIQVCTLHPANLQPRVFLASKRLILALKMLTFFTIEWPTGLSRRRFQFYGLARLWDKRQFVYNLSTNCVQFVLVLSSFCPKFVTTKTTKIFVICQVLDKNKTKVRQMTNCLQIVLILSCFCTKFDKWQFFCCFVVTNFRQKQDKN